MNQEYQVKKWILDQSNELDKCISNASVEYYNSNREKPYFKFDVNETIEEMGVLSKGDDLCYDRPSIGFSYSLWYHGKRLNGMLDFFIKLLLEAKNEKQIEIFDLGAGTGAIQWAVGLVYLGMHENGLPVPKIKIVNIDSSPFMLEYSQNYLWEQFLISYPKCKKLDIDYSIISWVNLENREYNNVWLCASYLFDHSENQQLIADAFKELAEKYYPQKIILLGNWQKKHLIDNVATAVAGEEYNIRSAKFSWSIFEGTMNSVKKIRKVYNSRSLNFSGTPEWKNNTWYGKVLEPKQIGLGLSFPKKYNLYQKAEKDRSIIQLTQEQQKAAKITDSPVIIIGPAGCGKSVVLTEKVKNIVEKEGNEYDPKLNILLTTFNKDLVEYLGDWLESILSDKSKFERSYISYNGIRSKYCYFTFKGSIRSNITVMHFDVLPTRIGGLQGKDPQPKFWNHRKYHLSVMTKAMKEVIHEKSIDDNQYKSVLDKEFLLEEYHRVKYGLQCHTNKAYSEVSREGRGIYPQLKKGKKRREVVISIFRKYKSLLARDNCESYIIRRERFLKKLNRGEGGASNYTHLLVDELQDCCNADYDIFYALLKKPEDLTVAGDMAQSINIGTTARVPRPRNAEMKRFQKIYLKGSFRLPFRVGECIKPLSERIKEKFSKTQNVDVYEIIPYKGAPPGARPIFIYDKNPAKLADKIKQVFDVYKTYDNSIEMVDVFEERDVFLGELNNVGLKAAGHIVQKIKGMEKPFVVWDTLAQVNTKNEVEEFIYTILTRTTNILIIAVNAKLITSYFEIIKDFKEERLIFWSKKSRDTYRSICTREFETENIEDDGDNEDSNINNEEEIDI